MAVIGWQSQRSTPLLVTKAGVAGGGALFFHGANVQHKNPAANPQNEGQVIKTSTQPQRNPASAQPIKGLSARGQKLIAPRSFGQMTRPIEPRNQGEIPKALRSNSVRG